MQQQIRSVSSLLCSIRNAASFRAGMISLLGLVSFNVATVPAVSQPATQPQTPPGTGSTAPTLTPGAGVTRPILQVGSQGAMVAQLQALLKLLGYYDGAVDGVYQVSTAAAVTAFQQAAGLQPDGVVGPNTWNRLLPPSPTSTATGAIAPAPTTAPATPTPAAANPVRPGTATPGAATPRAETPAPASVELPILRLGMRGTAVARLQERLRATGFFNGVVDGIFGPETQAAVKAAQRNYRLDPDGVVGPATWTALLR